MPGTCPQSLLRIHEPGINLAILRRSRAEVGRELVRYIDRMTPEIFIRWVRSHGGEVLQTDTRISSRRLIWYHAHEACAIYGTGDSLISDIAQCIGWFRLLISASRVCRFRVEYVQKESGQPFHVDFLHQRMLVNYRTPGTEWLPCSVVNYEAVREGLSNRRICLDMGKVRQLPRFAVAVFKGDEDSGTSRGLVHRSPDVRAPQSRILLTIDDVSS